MLSIMGRRNEDIGIIDKANYSEVATKYYEAYTPS